MKLDKLNLRKYFPIAVLVLLEILLFSLNYKVGTYLVGWDNLFPELNFSENFKRSLFSLWQEYRGLGLLDGMSYAANLPHYLVVWILSVFLPQNLVRYIFIFGMHLVGGLGIYFLCLKLNLGKAGSFFAALFYLLNLATMQMFYAPFELFAVHFAYLPFLILETINFLKNGLKKDLVWLAILSFLAVPQAHVPTLFIVYAMALFVVLVFSFINSHQLGFKRQLVVLLLTFSVNAFWGLPYVYSAIKNSKTISESKINQMTSEDVYLKNKSFGNFVDTALLKGFEFNMVEIQSNRSFDYILSTWRKYTDNNFFKIVSFVSFGLAFAGLMSAILKKQKEIYPFVFLFLFSFMMLGQDIPVVNFIPQLMNRYIPFFKLIFRFTFTKFSILYAFSYSLLIGSGISLILSKVRNKRVILYALILGMALFFLIYSWPSWKGNFLYNNVRLEIPDEYFQTINYFKDQDQNTRVATFPQASFWGWTYTKWNYRGSGYLWFGIPQPTMEGAFYPWSRENENYYWEITNALYSKNRNLFEKVLEKYQINWLLVDENVINPGAPKAVFVDELEALLSCQPTTSNCQPLKFELVKTFGKIKIYKVNLEKPVRNFVYLAEDLPVVNGYEWGNIDQAYNDLGDYIANNFQSNSKQSLTTNHQSPTTSVIYYPFRSLFTGRTAEDLDFQIEDEGDSFIFKKNLPKGVADYELVIPPYKGDELVEVDKSNLSKVTYLIPTVEMKEGKIEVTVPKVNGLFSPEINPTQVAEVLQAKNCNQFSNGRVENKDGLWVVSRVMGVGDEEKKVLRLEAEDATNCSAAFWLPDLPNKYGYLISAETRNISGKPLLFWLENLTNRKADLEVYLEEQPTDRVIQPPMAEDGLGYSLHFDNISIGRQKTINELGRVTVNPIPYQFLTSLKLVNKASGLNDIYHLSGVAGGVKLSDLQGVTASHLEVNHPNPAVYEIKMKQSMGGNETLVLSQAYHEGWIAYEIFNKFSISKFLKQNFPFFFGKKIDGHLLINNWSNGWSLPTNTQSLSPKTYVIVFWPQYLEYAGFVILLSCYIAILLKKTM